jgi:hypothetical protein
MAAIAWPEVAPSQRPTQRMKRPTLAVTPVQDHGGDGDPTRIGSILMNLMVLASLFGFAACDSHTRECFQQGCLSRGETS